MDVRSAPLRRALAENSQKIDFAQTEVVRSTEPSEDGVFDLGHQRPSAPAQLLLIPICAGNGEFLMRVFGWWNHGVLNQTVGTVWVKLLLAEFRCVSGSQTGLDSRFVGANEMFCSSMALTTGTVGNGLVQNLENGSPSWAKMDMQGCRKFQVECCNVDGSAFGNALLMETSTP